MLGRRLRRILRRYSSIPMRIARIQEALGRIELRQVSHYSNDIRQAEFRVFSQWGEDGIIQYLVHSIDTGRRTFVEFGVEDYTEANTRFLLINNQWSGLVIDASADNIAYIKRDPIYWACNLKAELAFVTRDNINAIIEGNGISGDIGLLSVDIDGNDYWLWQAIEVISPRIVVCEYNSHFGPTAQITIPYDAAFTRDKAHFSKVYYGTSIASLHSLGRTKGYSLVASNSAGNNIFFVRDDVIGTLRSITPAEAYRRSQFREHHDEGGQLTFYDFETRLRSIGHLPVLDLSTNTVRRIADVIDTGSAPRV
jgi:hypothetical protein